MKTKITLHKPVFIFLTRTKNFEIKIPKFWNNFLQNMIFLIKKMVSVCPFFYRSITIYAKIVLIPIKVNKLIRITQPIIHQKTFRSNIYY